MTPQRHRIRRQVLEVAVGNRAEAWSVQSELSRIQSTRLLAIIENCLSAHADPNQIIRIDKLEINLGRVRAQNLEQDLVEKLGPALNSALSRRLREDVQVSAQISEDPKAASQLELLTFFAQTGDLPWWVDTKKPQIIDQALGYLLQRGSRSLLSLLRTLIADRDKLLRIVQHCEDDRLAALGVAMASSVRPELAGVLLKLPPTLQALVRAQPVHAVSSKAQWRNGIFLGMLRAIVEVQGRSDDLRLWHGVLGQIALAVEMTYAALLEWMYTTSAQPNDLGWPDEIVTTIRVLYRKQRAAEPVESDVGKEAREIKEYQQTAAELARVREMLEGVLREREVGDGSLQASQHPAPPKRLPAGGEADERSESEGWKVLGTSPAALKSKEPNTPTPPAGFAVDRPASEAVLLDAAAEMAPFDKLRANGVLDVDQQSAEASSAHSVHPEQQSQSKVAATEMVPFDKLRANGFLEIAQQESGTSLADSVRPERHLQNSVQLQDSVPPERSGAESKDAMVDTAPFDKLRANGLGDSEQLEPAQLGLTQLLARLRNANPDVILSQAAVEENAEELKQINLILWQLQRAGGPLAMLFAELQAQVGRAPAQRRPALLGLLRELQLRLTSENLATTAPEIEPSVQETLRELAREGVLPPAVLRRCIAALRKDEEAAAEQADPEVARQRARRRAILEKNLAALTKKMPVDLKHSDVKEAYVENAGVVLLWPFFANLLERLELWVEKRFVNDQAVHRAVGLLQYLVSGEREPQEFQLTLIKILCGMDPREVFRFGDPVTDLEAEECQLLLDAVILHAKVFGELTVDELREAFLVRKGVLSFSHGVWLLRVERFEHDVALRGLPWATSWIKLPWLESPIQVEW